MGIKLTRRSTTVLAVGAALAVGATAFALVGSVDWGAEQQADLQREADDLYGGIGVPLPATSTPVAGAEGAASVALSSGLRVRSVLRGNIAEPDITDQLGQNADMIAFWPTDTNPEWGIVCIEGAPLNGVQRIKLRGVDKGKTETIFTGTVSCDGIRRTPWNTILATEEASDGWGIEVYDPLNTTNVAFSRTTGTTSGGTNPENVVSRLATGRYAWEGMYIRDNGVMYSGDELAPSNDNDGGAIFKYVPDSPAPEPMTAAAAATLSQVANKDLSPFAAGKLYALQIGSKGGGGNVGQGNQLGEGRWVLITPGPTLSVRAAAAGVKATGYYRPEDLEGDSIAATDGSFRFCWNNTGVSSRKNWGEVLCAADKPSPTEPTGTTPDVQLFLAGNSKLNQPDNIEFQPKTGIVYVIEDTPTVDGVSVPGDIWACLRDGADDDTQSDGCVRVVSVVTDGSEPTGFKFDASGRRAFLNIQHSPDNPATATVNEARYDEMLEITGFEPDEAEAAR